MDKKQTGFISISLWNVKNSTSPGWQPRTGGTKSQKSLRLCLTRRIQTKKEKAYQEAFSSISKQWVGRQPSIVQRLCFLRWFQHIFEYQTNKAQKLTRNSKILTTVFHPPPPPGRPWVWVSASPWRPWLQEGDRHCGIPPETCFGEDTCTGCQEKTLKRKNVYRNHKIFETVLSVSQLLSKRTFSFPS